MKVAGKVCQRSTEVDRVHMLPCPGHFTESYKAVATEIFRSIKELDDNIDNTIN